MPETATDLVRSSQNRAPARTRTDALRLKHRDYVRARRAEEKAEREEALRIADPWSLESICAEEGLNLSPQSSLNPVYWNRFLSPHEGLYLGHIRRGDDQFRGNHYLFAKAA